MAPIVSPAQHMAIYERYMTFSLREATFEKRRENGGSSDEVEERDISLKYLSTLPDPASEKSSDHSDTSPGHSKIKPVPMAQAKAISKPVKTATPTHETAPKSTHKSALHHQSSSKAAPKQSPRTFNQQNPSPTTMTETPKAIPISLSLPRSSSILPPLQGHPPGKHSPSLSPPPPQKHSISSRNQAIGAGLGSAAAIGLLIGLFYLLRHYCRQGRSTKPSYQTRKQKQKDEEAHPGKKDLTFKRKRKEEEAHPRKRQQEQAREAMTGGVIEMVRPAPAQRRDFGSQFSPSLESQLQRADTQVQEAGGSDGDTEGVEQSLRPPLVPQRTISYFTLPSPVVGVAETAAAFSSGDARIVYLTPSSDGGDVGRVVSLGDSCVIEMLVRVMNDDDEERREGDDGDRVGIIAQESREIDGVVVTVADLGTRVVEEAEDESGGEGRVDGGVGWSRPNGDLGGWVDDHPHLDGRELDSEDERDDCSFKSTRGSIASGKVEEGGKSGDDEQTEGAGRDGGATAGFENTDWVGTASDGRKGGDSGYEDDADSYGGDEEDDAYSNPWDR